MKRCAYQQTALMGGCVGEIRRGNIYVSDGNLVCPKPRRIGLFNSSYVHADEPIRPSRYMQINNQQPEPSDLKARTELLNIILTKGSCDVERTSFEMASSPPFFFGSPPTRASNPLIQDAQFGNDNFVPILALPEGSVSNPLIQDSQFGNDNFVPILAIPEGPVSDPLIQDSHFGNDNFVPILAIPEGAVAAPSPGAVSNPLIQDALFGNDNFVPILAIPEGAVAAPSQGAVSNPLIQDAQFGNDNFVPILAFPEGAVTAPSPLPSFTSTSARKSGGGCIPVKFGIKPAAVRIEGFNCCSSISAVA